MNERLLQFLCCPLCGREPRLGASDKGHMGNGALHEEPFLKCSCGVMYPVIGGVPRFVEWPRARESGRGLQIALPSRATCSPTSQFQSTGDYDDIRKSFSKEWSAFDYSTDKTWGWTLEQRKQIFLEDMALAPEQVRGKTLLDAGCGNGMLTAALGTLGMEVIGMDLNDMLGAANQNKNRAAGTFADHVHFVQGNLVAPPLKHNAFDLIYCSGVIHHTPNPRETFSRLVGLVKPGGRLYVWVYGKRNVMVRLFMTIGRALR